MPIKLAEVNQGIIECFTAGPVMVSNFRDVEYPDTKDSLVLPSMMLSTAYGDDATFRQGA